MQMKFRTIRSGAAMRRIIVAPLIVAVSLLVPRGGLAQAPDATLPPTGIEGTAAAEAQGIINGTIITPEGEPLPNAEVRARNLLTGEVSGTTTTGPGGEYSFAVDPGNYVVEVLGENGLVIATTAFVSAVAGVTLATAATVAATAGALSAVSSVTGLAAVIGTSAARTVSFAAAAAGAAGGALGVPVPPIVPPIVGAVGGGGGLPGIVPDDPPASPSQ